MTLRRSMTMISAMLVAGCGTNDDATARPSGTVASATSWSAALIDSAAAARTRGDTIAARVLLAKAAALGASSPALIYRVAAAQEAVGDVGGAARTYRRYLSVNPTGDEAQRARDRLVAIVSGPESRTRVVGGETAPTIARDLSDPAIRPGATSAPNGASSARAQVAATTPRRVRPPRARTQLAVRRTPQAPPSRRVDTALTALASAERISPPAESSAVLTRRSNADVPSARVSGLLATVPDSTSDAQPIGARRIHYGRWSRMQSWFVARVAGLGGAGGVVVGALIGNVPGAIAVGLAGGAAGGLAKVHQDKVDSAQMLKVAANQRVHRDSSAGVLDLPLHEPPR